MNFFADQCVWELTEAPPSRRTSLRST